MERRLGIRLLYLRDASFEVPLGDQAFSEDIPADEVETRMRMRNDTREIAGGYEVVLTLNVTATLKDGRTLYSAEIRQAGIFEITGFSGSDLFGLLGGYCPNQLFPFAREAITNLVARGGFPRLMIPPVNLDAIYAQHAQEAASSRKGVH